MYLLFIFFPLYNSILYSLHNYLRNNILLRQYIIGYTIFNTILLAIAFYEIIFLQNTCIISLGK